MTENYDVAMVGGGPAGCAAGVFCSRAGLDTVKKVDPEYSPPLDREKRHPIVSRTRTFFQSVRQYLPPL